MNDKCKRWIIYCLVLIIVLVAFGIMAPSKARLFVIEAVIWIGYISLITLTEVTPFKVWFGYLISVLLTATAILLDK